MMMSEFVEFLWESLEKINTMQKSVNRVEDLVVAMVVLVSLAVLVIFAVLLGFGCKKHRQNQLPKKRKPIEI